MFADKLLDVANLAVGALFLGQFLSERPFSLMLAMFSVVVWVTLTSFALFVAGLED